MHTFVLGDARQLFHVVLCRAAAVLGSAEALGIDVEWRPTGSQGGSQKASILQVPPALPLSRKHIRHHACRPCCQFVRAVSTVFPAY